MTVSPPLNDKVPQLLPSDCLYHWSSFQLPLLTYFLITRLSVRIPNRLCICPRIRINGLCNIGHRRTVRIFNSKRLNLNVIKKNLVNLRSLITVEGTSAQVQTDLDIIASSFPYKEKVVEQYQYTLKFLNTLSIYENGVAVACMAAMSCCYACQNLHLHA